MQVPFAEVVDRIQVLGVPAEALVQRLAVKQLLVFFTIAPVTIIAVLVPGSLMGHAKRIRNTVAAITPRVVPCVIQPADHVTARVVAEKEPKHVQMIADRRQHQDVPTILLVVPLPNQECPQI